MPRKVLSTGKVVAPADEVQGFLNEEVASSERNRMTFGHWLTARREEVGLTQSELAERAGLTRSVVNAYERGKIGLPSADKRRALAEALRVRHIDILVAAGEVDATELVAGTPKNFTRYPELQADIERLTPDAADALHDFMYFLMRSPSLHDAPFQRPALRSEYMRVARETRNRLMHGIDEE